MTTPAHRRLPGGTVTFVFLDIEGSTELLQELGSDYPALLQLYKRLTGEAIERGGGVVFGSEGDGIFAAFPEAEAAVRSTIEAQRAYAEAGWPHGKTVEVRVGIHTGTPTVIGDDYTGIDVHRTARIMSAGWGGQVLLSEVTRSLITGSGIECRDLGWYDMKGLSRPERICQLEVPGLPDEFPPVRARRREIQLPVKATSFVDREDEMATVTTLLNQGTRLLTLTGPGGIGKSRIAAAAASLVEDRYADGVAYVDLSNETDADRIATTIAEKIGVAPDPNHLPLDVLADHLRPLELLLVLDGFERVTEAAVSVATLLSRCPTLSLLITSRAPLRVGAERELRVGPLSSATPDTSPTDPASAPAVRLFLERAMAVRPEFELTPANSGVVQSLVERLEGVPLSIEFAAARSRLLPPEAIMDSLGATLDLASSSPELPSRQRSLRATIEWSHGLLTEPDQRVLRRLGVFVDGWDLEAAEAVAGDTPADVFLSLENLVSQSIIDVDADGRMSMGTAMREFALEQLQSSGEAERARLRHAEHYEHLLVVSEPLLRGRRQRELVAALSREWRNLRTAASWALETGRVQLAGSLYVRTWIVAWQGDNWADAEAFTSEFMAVVDQLDEPLRAMALFVAAGTKMEMGDAEAALAWARPAVELAERIGDKDTEAWARLMVAGSTLLVDPADPEARAQIARAVELAESIDDPFVLGYALSFGGAIATMDGDVEAGLASHRRVLAIARELDNVSLLIQTCAQGAMTHLSAGQPASARELLEIAVESLESLRSLETLAVFLDAVSWLAFAEGDEVRALTALGAANATRAKVGLVRWALIAGLLESAGVAAEAGRPELAEARQAGATMSPHDAIVYALQPHRELAVAG